jgi:hypothetical protein
MLSSSHICAIGICEMDSGDKKLDINNRITTFSGRLAVNEYLIFRSGFIGVCEVIYNPVFRKN